MALHLQQVRQVHLFITAYQTVNRITYTRLHANPLRLEFQVLGELYILPLYSLQFQFSN